MGHGVSAFVPLKKWTAFWKRALKLDDDPVVDIRAIKPKNKHKTDIKSAMDETAKYPVKDTDYMTDDKERKLQIGKDLEEGLYRQDYFLMAVC